ncbi:MAG: J domain-containing protein [Ruminococcus sp.]|nr:J domain-containing protein [Ruminococcus sp.]
MNPYQVLGVAETATDAEIKNAYRELAKKYHPDNYTDSPLADLAEQKMKEINEAYDMICDMRKNPSSSSNSSYYNGSYGSSQYTHTNFPDVRRLIKEGRLDDAMQILNGVSTSGRNGEWYFLMGMVFSRKGWTEQAFSYFQTACRMEPNNPEFISALNNINARRNYNPSGYNTVNSAGCSVCDICAGIMCADCLCDCCGGGGCC